MDSVSAAVVSGDADAVKTALEAISESQRTDLAKSEEARVRIML